MSLGHNDKNLARMNTSGDLSFLSRAILVAIVIIAAAMFWLAGSVIYDRAVAQTAACHPDCAVGPYHQEMEQ